MAGWIKMPLGREVGLSEGHIVLVGDPGTGKKGNGKKGNTPGPGKKGNGKKGNLSLLTCSHTDQCLEPDMNKTMLEVYITTVTAKVKT